MKHRILLLAFLIFYSSALFVQNTFPTSSGTVGIGTSSSNSKTQLHIYRNAAGTVPILWKEDDDASGYTQIAFGRTSALFHVGVVMRF